MTCGWRQSPATTPMNPASSAGMLGLVLPNSFLLFAFTAISGSTEKVHSLQHPLLVPALTLGAVCPGVACSLPLHHVRRNHGLVGNCSGLLGQTSVSPCHTFVCVHMSGRGDLELLQNPAAMSEKYKCILLCIWESFVVEPRRCACMMDTCSAPWSDPQDVTQSATSELQKYPTRIRNGSSG